MAVIILGVDFTERRQIIIEIGNWSIGKRNKKQGIGKNKEWE